MLGRKVMKRCDTSVSCRSTDARRIDGNGSVSRPRAAVHCTDTKMSLTDRTHSTRNRRARHDRAASADPPRQTV